MTFDKFEEADRDKTRVEIGNRNFSSHARVSAVPISELHRPRSPIRRVHGCAGNYKRGTCILRSAQFLRSATVKRSRNGFALIIFSRLLRPVASAFAITRAASASSIAVRNATAPAAPAK